jgi:hypothetical protein
LASSVAWERDEGSAYGHGLFPHGPCSEPGCGEAACFNVPPGRLVCLEHKPQELFFWPFLGQQTKIWNARERWVLAGGGAGPGKTYVGARLWLKQHGASNAEGDLEHARWMRTGKKSQGAFLFTRRTMPELDDQIEEFRNYKDAACPRHKWSEQKSLFVCECGYKVKFGGMEGDEDWRKYFGSEWTLVAMDESWTNTVEQIEKLDTRVRCSDPVLQEKVQIYFLTNPMGSEAKQWMKEFFEVAKHPQGEVSIAEPVKLRDGRIKVEHKIYIPSNLYDNPALMKDGGYEANLARRSAGTRRMLLQNDWNVDQGAWVGDDWDADRHVIAPHPIPAAWPKYKEADYGYDSLTVVHWMAVDPEGGVVCYRAWSCRLLTAYEVGLRIRQIESEPLFVNFKAKDGTKRRIMVVPKEWDDECNMSNVRGPLDAATWAKTGETGESRGEILEKLGTGFYRSDKGTVTRHSAAERIRWRLRNVVRDPFDDKKDVPALRFFRGTTENMIENKRGKEEMAGPIHTLPRLAADKNDPDVPDTKGNDHDWDALAYGTGTRPTPGEEPQAEVYDFVSFRDRRRDRYEKINW